MFPKGLTLAILLGIVAGPVFGIILFEVGEQEQLIFVEGSSLSIVTEKIDFKLAEPILIKIVNSGTDKLTFPNSSYGLVIKQLDSIPIYSPISTQVVSKLESHDEVDFIWNQLKNDGTQILEGTYKISVKASTTNEKIIEKIITINIFK